MPCNDYIKVVIGDDLLDLTSADDIPISINYEYEGGDNFQTKKSTTVLNLTIPATNKNIGIANIFHNSGYEDLTENQSYRNFQTAIIEANGAELFIGKALLTEAVHTDRPLSYSFDLYGQNGDWILPLKEATLYDFLKHIQLSFTKQEIINSWDFNGANELLPYVFAPVRYTKAIGNYVTENINGVFTNIPITDTMAVDYLKPSLSVYWLIYWGFKSVGYRIRSEFLNTEYFRRLVMPWTWGEFLLSEGTRQDNLDFLAKSSQKGSLWNATYNGVFDCHVDNDSTNGAFDNTGVYDYDNVTKEMRWVYSPQHNYGPIEATFHFNAIIKSTVAGDSWSRLYLRWYKNGTEFKVDTLLHHRAPLVGKIEFGQAVEVSTSVPVEPNDIISAKIFIDQKSTSLGRANVECEVMAFEFLHYSIPMGGTIDFTSYASLKKYKFLDFFAGVLDLFNISPQTDSINKLIVLEPQHNYSLTSDLANTSGGYFNGDFIDWSEKQDISKESVLSLFNDAEREFVFRFKEDSNDGLLKVVQQRNATIIGQGKYLFPERFKSGKKDVENRFFSPVIHVEMKQWVSLGNNPLLAPQMICLVADNVANTSKKEAENSFLPKICYYKGLQNNVGWRFDNENLNQYPFMFAVNYQPGGENDPVLSYSDEAIGDERDPVIAAGLLRRFYLQRMAIMRNGQFYKTYFRLNNNDITNWFHREHIHCRDQKWELFSIVGHRPLKPASTEVFLKKHVPVAELDADNVFPSKSSIQGIKNLSEIDLKYMQAKALANDLPDQNI